MAKIRKLNEETWQRAGYRGIYLRLLDIGCFNEPMKSPMQSVYDADFEEAVKIISLKNTGI